MGQAVLEGLALSARAVLPTDGRAMLAGLHMRVCCRAADVQVSASSKKFAVFVAAQPRRVTVVHGGRAPPARKLALCSLHEAASAAEVPFTDIRQPSARRVVFVRTANECEGMLMTNEPQVAAGVRP